MRTIHVESAALASIAYTPVAPEYRDKLPSGATGFLLVEFASGQRFGYAVPPWCVGLLMASRSKGRGFHKLIRERGFRAVKLEN